MLNSAQFLRAMHPRLNDYTDEYGEGESRSIVGFVPTHLLTGMHGNETDREGIDRHKEALRSGRGFTDPIMVDFDPKRKLMTVGEGNHRVEAARELGISHVPVRVHRSIITNDELDYMKRHGGNAVPVSAVSPWKNGQGAEYWPPGIHPKHIFPGVL